MRRARTSGVWGRLADAIDERGPAVPEDGHLDVSARLRTLVDPAEDRPKLASDVEIKEFKLRWGNDYAMIGNPRELIHYRLTPAEVELVKLMDGTRTIKEIVLERLQGTGDLDLSGVADLVFELQVGNFLDRPYVQVFEALDRAIRPVPLRRQRLARFFKTLRLDWKGADRLVRWLYRHGVRHMFKAPVAAVGGAVALAGFVAFVSLANSGDFGLSGRSLALGFLILMALNYFLTFVHELGHAVVLTHYGRKVKSAGFMIFFGSPAFFVDAADANMLERRQRILQAFAGPYGEALVSGTASILVWLFPNSVIAPTLYKFAVLNYLVLFMNLIPLLELDGYWMVSDIIQVPDLRPRSLAFVRHELWRKLRGRTRFSKQEIGLALYGILGVGFTIFSFYAAYFLWRQVFGALIIRLWDASLVGRVILAALAISLAGPVVRGGIKLALAVGRRLGAVWRAVHFRMERRWRIEAATLIDALPLFDDVPEDVLGDLAGRIRLRSIARGRPVVRQGERATAFYVIRSGTFQVVEEDAEAGNERVLRILGRGESFGELGLIDAAPRAATVRALDEAQVFEIGKGTFDRLLADMARVPTFAPTLQAKLELRGLPSFAHLEPDELSALLEHGAWINVPPGQAIIEQGQDADAFYAIRSGQVDVYRDSAHLRTMGPGAYFGEIALIANVPRTATVVAKTPVRAYRLERAGFDGLVRDAFRSGTLNPSVSQDRTWEH
jgi:CRP-like cAMP-binding protein/Zn-dependent protease